MSRRAALTGAAWTAPVIVAAGAAPAHAVSGGGSGALTFARGASVYGANNGYHAVYFDGHTLTCSGPEIPAGMLTASITSSEIGTHFYNSVPGSAWLPVDGTSQGMETYRWAYQDPIPPGGSPAWHSTSWSFTKDAPVPPTFTVTFTAPGYTSAGDVFSAPAG